MAIHTPSASPTKPTAIILICNQVPPGWFIVRSTAGCARLRAGLPLAKRFYGNNMRLNVNGKPYEVNAGSTVSALLETLALTSRVAVAVNGSVSPRSEHASRVLEDGDNVEVIHAVAGG